MCFMLELLPYRCLRRYGWESVSWQHWIPNFPLFHSNTAYQFHSWNTRFYYCLKKHKESALMLFLFHAHTQIPTFIQPKTSILFIFSTGLNDIDMKVLMTFFGSYRLFAIFFFLQFKQRLCDNLYFSPFSGILKSLSAIRR